MHGIRRGMGAVAQRVVNADGKSSMANDGQGAAGTENESFRIPRIADLVLDRRLRNAGRLREARCHGANPRTRGLPRAPRTGERQSEYNDRRY